MTLEESGVLAGQLGGISVVELLCLVELGVAERRCVHAQAADAFERRGSVEAGGDVGVSNAMRCRPVSMWRERHFVRSGGSGDSQDGERCG